MQTLSSTILEQPVVGLNLPGGTVGELVRAGPGATLLVFLRHFGCIFCKEMVRDLKLVSAEPNYPGVVFFGQGDLEESRAFAEKVWPEMSIVCDPDRVLFNAMGLGKGSVYQMFGPSVWACAMRAGLKGNFQGRPVGDIWTMPGAFAVDPTGRVLWRHEFEHAGHHPDWSAVPDLIRGQEQRGPATGLAPPARASSAS